MLFRSTRINALSKRNKGKIWRRRFPVVGLVYMQISRQNGVITASKPLQFPAELSRLTFPSGKNRKLEKSTGRSAEIAIYLPHNPADPPKTTNTSIRHMAFHGVQEFMVLPKFTSFSFWLRQLTTTENSLKHSTS